MPEIINIVLPVFALIGIGYLFRRTNILSAAAITELNRFVVYLALPALTIDIITNNSLQTLWQPAYIITFEIAVILTFFPVLFLHWYRKKDLAEASIEATAASYANNGYIGIPLAMLAFGPEGLAPTIVAGVLTIAVNFAVSIVLIETGLSRDAGFGAAIRKIGLSMLKNPLIIAPLAGCIMLVSGLAFPEGVGRSIKLLGMAACPCALVATGLFLAQKQAITSTATAIELVIIKLFIQPLIAWYFAYHVFELPDLWAKSAVLLSALPTGTGPFMLAEMYQKGAGIASRSILLSTIISVVSLSVWLAVL